jgi:hypothetical protein
MEMESSGTPALPIILKLSVEMAAAEGNDSVGPADSPEHAGLLEPGTDYGLAPGFDDAGSDKQVLAAEFVIAHTFGISLSAPVLSQ